jgi:antitoxin component of MazEF toxin-antitoxin module
LTKHVSKWGNSLAIRLPAALVTEMKVKARDEVNIRPSGQSEFVVQREMTREEAIAKLRTYGTPLPTDNEFRNIQRNRLCLPWAEVPARLQFIGTLCPAPVPDTQSVHFRGLEIAQKHGCHICDALLLAAAIESSCTVFYSEDMQDGQVIDGLTIRNPFATPRTD